MASSGCKIKKILIANRGEIACRIIRTCRRLGIRTVAIFSEADRNALHVREADEVLGIGPAPSSESYLSIEKVLSAIRESKACAVHPGYGFLSEKSEFAEKVTRAGAVFIGPSAASMRLLGDKISSKKLALEHKVSTAPSLFLEGTFAKDSLTKISDFARKFGFPILVKASAGGGGRGMREIDTNDSITEKVESAVREAVSSFGDSAVFIEKVIRPARHIEVQIAGDANGKVLALGDRDCTWQRRNQKLVEEAPAPNVSPSVRRGMHAAACRLAKAAGYTNLGTVEFLLDTAGRFYFLEVNSRLQVEHPVTELTTGLDLVELQILLAEGRTFKTLKVPAANAGKGRGHAIEARLCAESDPGDGSIQMSTGVISRFETLPLEKLSSPSCSMRLDTGFAEGDSVTHFYDSLLAKVIVKGRSREDAIDLLQKYLAAIRIEGILTNSAVLQMLLQEDSFRRGRHSIDLYAHSPWISETLVESRTLCAGLFAVTTIVECEEEVRSWSSLRSGLAKRAIKNVQIDAIPYTVTAVEKNSAAFTVEISTIGEFASAPTNFEFDCVSYRKLDRSDLEMTFRFLNTRSLIRAEVRNETPGSGWIHIRGASFRFGRVQSVPARVSGGGSGDLRSPLPGRVVKINTVEGAPIRTGDAVVTIESMKMEHTVKATAEGTVKDIVTKIGDTVDAGSLLARVVYTRGR